MLEYEQVRDLFDRAVELPQGQRRDYIQLQDVPASVKAEVLDLLNAFETETGLFDRRPAVPMEQPEAPARIGPYRIDGTIGSGGMGVVYRAFRDDDAFQKKVAIKISRLTAPAAEFRRERQILAGLEHPSIARLLDGGSTGDGLLYLVMEYVEGQPLLDAVRGRPLRERVRLFRQICEAVEYAHRNLVVHRDLKPSNILVQADGTPKLLDFGIARALSPESGASASTVFGMTPRYASPEQILHRPATTATDVYSLGVIFYELLTDGAYPYPTTSQAPGEIVEAALFAQAKAPSVENSKVDRDLDQIVLKALAREINQRYAGAAQLREDLDRYLDGRPVLAREAGAGYRFLKFVRRNRLATAACMLAAVALIAGAFGITRSARIADEQRAIAEQRRAEAEAASKRTLELLEEQKRLRASAEQRLATAQSLATSLLYDAYDSVRQLQGPADARLRIIDKAVLGLEALAKESPDDPKVRQVLATAFERAGDLALGVSSEGVSTTAVAITHYRKALSLFDGICARCQAGLHARMAFAQSLSGKHAEASASIARARAMVKDKETMVTVDDIECQVSQFGGTSTAEAACLRAAEHLTAFAGPSLLVRKASVFSKLAMNAKNNDKIEPAVKYANAASAAYAECLKQEPGRADCERGQAQIASQIALWQRFFNGPNAEQSFRTALAALRRVTGPSRKTTLLDLTQATVAMRFAELLHRNGKPAEAREAAKESLSLREARLASGNQSLFDINDFADSLLKCPIPELRDDAKALKYAEQAVAMTKRKDAFTLATLGDALYANRRVDEAVRTAKEALAILDKSNVPALRNEINESLRRYLQ